MYSRKKCPDCESTNLKTDRERGEITCRACGLIVEDKMIDFNKEWKDFDDTKVRPRAGAPLTFTKHDLGLGTQIGDYKDFQKSKQKGKLTRMMRWQYRSSGMEKNLRLALAQLKQMSSFLKLPMFIEEETARIYTTAAKNGLTKGRAIEYVITGALYAACRKYDMPRTLDELAEASGYDKKEILKSFKFLTRTLVLKFSPVSPICYLSKFANKLNIAPETESNAMEILKKADEKDITNGRAPIGIVAASLYIASLLNCEKRTQREIAEVTGVTEVTIRHRYHELVKWLNLQEKLRT